MLDKKKLIIGSRGSKLALWQANYIKNCLAEIKTDAEILIIKTQGDKIQDLSFDKLEGKGFFTKELEEALLAGTIDLAVHSHKDLTTNFPEGLTIAAVSKREDPADWILINKDAVDEKMKFSFKKNATVGTSSARRKAQLLAFRPDAKIEDLRGNVTTRIDKLKEKKYDAIILAAAGINRLNLPIEEDFFVEKLSPKEFVPAPAQGVLAIQTRASDKKLIEKLQALNNKEVHQEIAIERKILNLFDGGCQLPLGVYCEADENDEGEKMYKTWMSKSKSWNIPSKFFYFESTDAQTLPEVVVKKYQSIKPCTVFISRDVRKNDFFNRVLLENGYNVFNQSLIEIKSIDFSKRLEGKEYHWIFFSSKHAVSHFFDQKPNLLAGIKIGAVGKATADAVRKYNKRADFIGQSTNTKLIGKQFSNLIGNKIVLFPQAKGSLQSIQQQIINKQQVINVIVYETIKNNQEQIPAADILVFTSPSNVEAFFEKNNITSNQKIVAMGGATASTLEKFTPRRAKQPISFDDLGLLQAVFSL